MLSKEWFTLIDAIEDVSDLHSFGNNNYGMPTQGAYVPPSHYIVKIPDLNEPNADDTSYRFGNTRVSPYFMHTALKSH